MKNGRSGHAFALRAGGLLFVLASAALAAQPPAAPQLWVAVRPIEPPATPLASEAASAAVTKFSFFAYGDTRSSGVAGVPGDGDVIQRRVEDRPQRSGELTLG